MTRTMRWAVLLAGVALALVYLNSAVYSAWAGGGPPTTIREAWMHRAFAHLCCAVAAALGGVILFRVIRRPPRLDRAALVLAVLALVLMAAPHLRRFLLVDRCLDSGGRWDAAASGVSGRVLHLRRLELGRLEPRQEEHAVERAVR